MGVELQAYLCIGLSTLSVMWFIWRITRPWDQRGTSWFSSGGSGSRDPLPEPNDLRPLQGWHRLHSTVPLEGNFDGGWSARPTKVSARIVLHDGVLVTEKQEPVDTGELAFVSPSGAPLIAQPLPPGVDERHLEGAQVLQSPHARLRFLLSKGGLLFVLGDEGGLLLATAVEATDVRRLLSSLRPVGQAPAPERRQDRVELRVCNDATLADLLARQANRGIAFEQLAPGLNVLFIDKPHPDSAAMELLDHDQLREVGGLAPFLERMALHIDPATVELQELGNDVLTNHHGNPHAASLVVQPRFFERLAPRFGDAMLVAVPSVSRVLISRDTPKHREALTAMLDVSPQIEGTHLVSTRLYRVTGAEWDEWSTVDAKN